MERVIQCPVCLDEDHCFEDVQTSYSSYICFKCGMTSYSGYKNGTDEWHDALDRSPQLIKDLKFYDEKREINWILTVLNMKERGIIYPDGTPDYWVWKYASPIDIAKEDREKYPVPGKDGEFYEKRLDIENAREYAKFCFMDAVKDMGITAEIGK